MKNKHLPIVITCGDPAGVGPEVALSAWKALRDEIPLCILIDPNFLPKNINIKIFDQPPHVCDIERNSLTVIRHKFKEHRVPSKPNPKNAAATISIIERGVQFVKNGQCAAICTMPISKSILKDGANFPFPGHTEYLAHLDGKNSYGMMLINKYLRVVPATIHIPIKDITKFLDAELIEKTIKTTHQELTNRFSISNPSIWISGLNPHAGEAGIIGDEEQKFIIPVIRKLQSEGYNLKGPMSADTMFYRKKRREFDAAVCMYHDQALIPIKTLDFHSSVNLTIGLSFIRTSPDHGTAFDIAGKNLANPTSTIEAINWLGICQKRIKRINKLQPIRQVIEKYDLNAKKSLGQNFIFDLNLTSKIARLAGDLTSFEILEIGAGPGGLTRGLLSEGAHRVVAIEKDKRCISALREIQNHYPERLQIIEGDANEVQQEKYFTKPVKVIANLPYNIGTKLLIEWLTTKDWPPFWHSLTLMFQNEVAERIAAKPGDKSYGRLSVLSNWRCKTSIKMKLNPEVFYPPPKVTSAVVQIEALKSPNYDANLINLEKVVATAFNQRRKMLRSSLKSLAPNVEKKLKDLEIDPAARAENLTIEEFCLLANHLMVS